MADLETLKKRLLKQTPELALKAIIEIRTQRRNSIVSAAKGHQAKAKEKKDKPKKQARQKKVDKTLAGMSPEQMQQLLLQLTQEDT